MNFLFFNKSSFYQIQPMRIAVLILIKLWYFHVFRYPTLIQEVDSILHNISVLSNYVVKPKPSSANFSSLEAQLITKHRLLLLRPFWTKWTGTSFRPSKWGQFVNPHCLTFPLQPAAPWSALNCDGGSVKRQCECMKSPSLLSNFSMDVFVVVVVVVVVVFC